MARVSGPSMRVSGGLAATVSQERRRSSGGLPGHERRLDGPRSARSELSGASPDACAVQCTKVEGSMPSLVYRDAREQTASRDIVAVFADCCIDSLLYDCPPCLSRALHGAGELTLPGSILYEHRYKVRIRQCPLGLAESHFAAEWRIRPQKNGGILEGQKYVLFRSSISTNERT
jgi:hypothetical protein